RGTILNYLHRRISGPIAFRCSGRMLRLSFASFGRGAGDNNENRQDRKRSAAHSLHQRWPVGHAGMGGQAWQTAYVLLVRIETDQGTTGWGEAFGYNVIPATRVAI